jgi:hypothetical protein
MTDFSRGTSPARPTTDGGPSAKDKAADVAQTGKQAASEVAQTATGAAKDVAQETKRQASDLLGKTRDELNEQVSVQQSSLVDSLRSLTDQLGAMTDNAHKDGTAVDVATKARDKARTAAEWLDGRDPNQVLDEVRKFGRDRPGAFLLGAVLAGVVAGRLTRGAVAVHADDSSDSSSPVATRPAVPGTRPPTEPSAPRHDALSAPIAPYQSAYEPGRTVTP